MVLDRAKRTIWIFKKRKKTNKKDLRTVLCKKRGEETKGEAVGAKDNLRQHPNRVLPATITIVGRKIGRHSIEPIIIQSGSLNRNYYLGGDERLWRRSFREVPAPLHTGPRKMHASDQRERRCWPAKHGETPSVQWRGEKNGGGCWEARRKTSGERDSSRKRENKTTLDWKGRRRRGEIYVNELRSRRERVWKSVKFLRGRAAQLFFIVYSDFVRILRGCEWESKGWE